MLPSKFERTNDIIRPDLEYRTVDENKSANSNVGPANYNIERVIGKSKIA